MTRLDLDGDVVDLLQALIDVESVSGNEQELADAVEAALTGRAHLQLTRFGNNVVARTDLGRESRVVVAGHLDTVPVAGNLPSTRTTLVGDDGLDGVEVITGRGSCDMKAGVAVALSCAATLLEPSRDVTWIFYDNEEVQADLNGLGLLAEAHPELLAGDFAVLGEPSNAVVEGGCQGTLRVTITLTGTAAHSARAWMGHNAIHDAADLLGRLAAYEPRTVDIDGLTYREGLNAVKITGGIAGNVIPDRCEVQINHRFAPDRTVEQAFAHVAEVFDGYELVLSDSSPGALPGLDRPAAQEFIAAVGGDPAPKFGWTDVARFSQLGVPAVNFGPGNPSKAHADDEFCPVAEVYACRDALLRWLG
ncbi:succinyl-diaminopimelate desuccinylase [Propionibacteriaceae bacterium Y2011]